MKTGKILIGLVLAGATGLIIGLSLASGKITRIWRGVRAKRGDSGGEPRDELKSRVTIFRRQVNSMVADLPVKTRSHISEAE